MLGTIRAGGVYVPLAKEDPGERHRLLLEQVEASHLLHTDAPDQVPAGPWSALEVTMASAAAPTATVARGGDNPAYVMFTSGSTGSPKGVVVPHRGVARLVREADYAQFDARTVFLLLAPTSFDLNTLELWAPLLNGGTVAVHPAGAVELAALRRSLEEFGVTHLWLTSGLMHVVAEEDPSMVAGLRHLIAGGDVLSPVHLRRLHEAAPTLRISNGYGPTESTTFTTVWEVQVFDDRPVPIGRPIRGTSVEVLDAAGQPMPVGLPGELVAGGAGVALGYLGGRAEDDARFLPTRGVCGPLRYRTGDRAAWSADGVLQFLGRLDQQIKLRGFRVEPGEVENALLEEPEVQQASVGLLAGGGSGLLVGYVVTTAGFAEETCRARLAARLPEFLVPSRLFPLAELPLGRSGKVDRRALAKIGRRLLEETTGEDGAMDPTEAALAAAWAEVLGVPRPGRNDNFFALGGHSLMSVRLTARVKREFGIDVPLAVLHAGPTIAEMAAYMRGEWGTDATHLVRMGGGDDGPPMVLLPGAGGHPIHMRGVVDRLDYPGPILGVHLIGVDGREQPLSDVREMAERYLQEAAAVSATGPLLLVGYSAGGTLAYEMACQARAQGREVALLGLLDSPAPGFPPPLPLLTRVRIHLRNFVQGNYGGRLHYLRDRMLNLLMRFLTAKQRNKWNARRYPKSCINQELAAVNVGMHQALAAYRPDPYPGDMLFLRADSPPDYPATVQYHSSMGWDAFVTGRIRDAAVPGMHLGIFDEGNVEHLTRELQRGIDQALGRGA